MENIEDIDTMIHELAEQIRDSLMERDEMMATAESCTGGLVASSLVNEPGSSNILAGGIVAYQNEIKEKFLDVPHITLEQYGAVSEQTVLAMAKGARQKFGCEWAVSTSGIAGPGGAEPGKPVGTVWMCVAHSKENKAFCEIFSGNRLEIRKKSVYRVLSELLFSINRQKSTCSNEH